MRRAVVLLFALAACREEAHPRHAPAEPPVASPNAIPDAPVNGTLHGTQFVLREARYVVDRRVGYQHTDLVLSAGTAGAPCGPIEPAHATSVWLRLEGEPLARAAEVRLAPGDPGPWSVHYQIWDDDHWLGVGEGGALLAIREPGPDGHLSGGLAVCFSDDKRSCVSGSFDAQSCPPSIDQPVRGALPVEAIPARYRLVMFDAGVREGGP